MPLKTLAKTWSKRSSRPSSFTIGRAGEIVEVLGRPLDHLAVERLEQDEMLLEAGRNAGGAQLVEEGEEHQRLWLLVPTVASGFATPRRTGATAPSACTTDGMPS